jgi:DNA recombination protein RmuC
MFSAAVEQDPSLLDFGAEQGVLIATPVTLIALLRAVAIGWRQEDLARNAQEVAKVGNALYDGLQTFMEHYVKLGKNLDTAITAYNASVGSVERSVLSRARKLKGLYNKQQALKAPEDIDQAIRPLAVVQTSEDVLDIEESDEVEALPATTLDLD